MKTALDPRHTNRQKAVQELFAWAFRKQAITNDLAKHVTQNLTAIDQIISESAPEFPLNRINPVDLAILRLSTYELVVVHSEPPKAIIDEAVELAKEFGGENSPSFVNGALGKVLSSPGRIKKLIADHLGVEEKHLLPEADLHSDLNATDLEIADLIANLERDLNIEIKGAARLVTVGDLLNYIEDHKD